MSQKGKSKTSRWVEARGRDSFWRGAKVSGYRSRGAFKILGIDDAFGILFPGAVVVDLGCAPGGWAQVLARRCLVKVAENPDDGIAPPASLTMDAPASLRCKHRTPVDGGMDSRLRGNDGLVVGVDLLPMDSVDGVVFVQGDFLDVGVVNNVINIVKGATPPNNSIEENGQVQSPDAVVDVVVSDMAFNLSGVVVRDQSNASRLANAVMDFALSVLKVGGGMVVKCFEGEEFAKLRVRARGEYRRVAVFRPAATKAKSREVYIVGRGFLGNRG